jgi:starvation-inducible DNA-binding protein
MDAIKIDTAASTRRALIDLLQLRLAESVVIFTQARKSHLRVKGPHLIAFDRMFEDLAKEFREYADLMAERIAELGGETSRPVISAAERLPISPAPLDIADIAAHLEAHSTALRTFARATGAACEDAKNLGDHVTADLFSEFVRGIHKTLYLVDAHPEKQLSDAASSRGDESGNVRSKWRRQPCHAKPTMSHTDRAAS